MSVNAGEVIYKIFGDDSHIKKVLGNVGGVAAKSLAGIGTATAAASAAIAKLAEESVKAYADQEQLIGGVETLFGAGGKSIEEYADAVGKSVDAVRGEYESLMNAQETVLGNAANAFRTAGMSANEYMETVTGFSAALIASMGGDTEAAAAQADKAIIDMADNANKMGSSLESIQNAYQGFAKQNYTMLDNLKLGYGGTKEEMQRLLSDAEKLAGTKFDISSFADITEAIHVIQENMGIAGTTAEEAEKTITGSMYAMRAAWKNALAGMSDSSADMDKLINDLSGTVQTFLANVMPRIEEVLPGIANSISSIAAELLPKIPGLVNASLPEVLNGANALIETLLDVLGSLAETGIPIISENAKSIINTFVTGLADNLPTLIGTAADMITSLASALLSSENIFSIVQAAADIIISFANGISDNLPELVPTAVSAVITIAEALLKNIAPILEAAEELITQLAAGLVNAAPEFYKAAPELMGELFKALIKAIPILLEVPYEIGKAIGDTLAEIDWHDTAKEVLTNIRESFLSVAGTLDSSFAEVGQKIKQGIFGDFSDLHSSGNFGTAEDISAGAGIFDLFGQEPRSYVVEMIEETADEIGGAVTEAGNDIAGAAAESSREIDKAADSLDDSLAEIERLYKLHRYTEDNYWQRKKYVLEQNRDENSEDWWKEYDKVTAYYEKKAAAEESARSKAEREREQAAKAEEQKRRQETREQQQAENERLAELKKSVENEIRDLKITKAKEGRTDSWLYDEIEKIIAPLDPSSDLYKDWELRIAEGRKKLADTEQKEADALAKKRAETVDKTVKSIIGKIEDAREKRRKAVEELEKSRDKLSESMALSGSIFTAENETDLHTGVTSKKRGIDTDTLKKKVTARKKLVDKIARLLDAGVPDDIINELLNADPEAALDYANQLLNSPQKLKKVKNLYERDESYRDAIASLVTENPDEYKSLGEDTGAAFGEGFISTFGSLWDGMFKGMYSDSSSLMQTMFGITSANAHLPASSITPTSNTDKIADTLAAGSTAGKTGLAAPSAGENTVRLVDVNGNWLMTVIGAAQAINKITGGG